MNTLTYGYKKPVNPDTGDIFFPALENDIQQLNDHAHNGTDSAPLATQTATINSGSWAAAAGLSGVYSQTVTLPAGLSYDVCDIWMKLTTGERVYATITRVSATQYKVFTTDNTLNFTAYYR